ncbi:helix-turn-helix transcriptional regulator [Paramagnetospirillum magneticum]|uniref:AraC-type DNA-binding domain-containing protein n=1 Tax=Paramagnetospirillum magneticum (strain ATCC 700264 / AMB-1) TaxID=342108 RepID=Q2W884_PARM1|nr:helix-turn-helix transcriptional regulator [Paramagnetospirillum magneticum]BAE49941.1 AraC-type DNA-binding domain-containing protein [Paramagnetospirillum magneticum AMB-1]
MSIVEHWVDTPEVGCRTVVRRHPETFAHHALGDGADFFYVCSEGVPDINYKKVVMPHDAQLWIRVFLAGGDECLRPGISAPIVTDEERFSVGICRHPASFYRALPGGGSFEHVALALTPDRLRDYFGDTRCPLPLARMLDDRPETLALTPTRTAHMGRIVHDVRGAPYRGKALDFFLQGKVLEMLSAVVDVLDQGGGGDERVLGRERRRLLDVRDLLLANLTSPPDLVTVAHQVGSSPRRLNEAFRSEFGMTVQQWLLDQKMALAARLLIVGELSIKEIAYRLGYANRSAFTAAFSQHFGAPPAGFRDGQAMPHRASGTPS